VTAARPLVVVLDHEMLVEVRRELEADGWLCQAGFVPCCNDWNVAPRRVVCCGEVRSEEDAAAAALAAVRGAGVVVLDGLVPEITERLVEDLTRFGRVEVRRPSEPDQLVGLSDVQRSLLNLLARGLSLGEAAVELHLSRRTADRRLAAARVALGVRTTAEALQLVRCHALSC
jgi:DNA-binding NarL/FixJ family response regulator